MADRRLLRQGLGYGLVGGLQLLIDWLCFVGLTSVGIMTAPANIVGRVLGALVGFWLNGRVTFRDEAGGKLGWRRLGRFGMSWAVMSIFSTLAVTLVDHGAGLGWAWLFKPLVDGGLAVLGFLVSRYWIYK